MSYKVLMTNGVLETGKMTLPPTADFISLHLPYQERNKRNEW